MASRLQVPRPRFLTPQALEQIHAAASRILDDVGMRVLSEEGMTAARRLGLRVRGERAFIGRGHVDDFAAHTWRRAQDQPAEGEPAPDITLSPCQYAHHVHDIDTDEIVPFTTDRLIAMTKFMDTLTPLGVRPRAPGVPVDVPADLQALQKYRIQATYCREGRRPVEMESPRTMHYLMDMAEVLGHPITSAAVYVVSPLTLGGASLEYALIAKDRLRSLWVSNMSSMGATAPIAPGTALALGVAEVIGGAILAREAVGLPVEWSVRVCPFEPRAMSLSLGSPEELLLQYAFEEVNAWYHGREPAAPGGSLHTQAKLPDAQAVAEHLTILLTNALLGTRSFAGLGRLSLDEIFSPELAMIDIELRDHVQRLVAGTEVECEATACVREVMDGVAEGFLGLESTARSYAQTYWMPRLFWRGMLAEWRGAGAPELRARAKDLVRRQLAQHEYRLPADLWRELDRIFKAAMKSLSA
jgi:trimethylamine:corrinoid methyltransferase-like protein